MAAKWARLDRWAQIIVAVASSGSGGTGVSAVIDPASPDFVKWTWGVVTAFGTLTSTIYAVLKPADKMKSWIQARQGFSALRVRLERIRRQMIRQMLRYPDMDPAELAMIEDEYEAVMSAIPLLQDQMEHADFFRRDGVHAAAESEASRRVSVETEALLQAAKSGERRLPSRTTEG